MIEHIKRKKELIPLSFLLGFFATEKKISAYELCNKLKSTEYKRAYANVWSRVNELERLKLIEQTDKVVALHAAIYYHLTGAGVEHLLMDNSWLSVGKQKSVVQLINLIKIHGDQLPFLFFAYPYFGRQTLEQLRNSVVIHTIFSYLAQCVEDISIRLKLVTYNNLVPEQLEAMIKYFSENVSSRYAENCAFTLIDFADKRIRNPYEQLSISDMDYMDEDLRLLAKDQKFLKLLKTGTGKVYDRYKKFIKYQK
jgi:hypothetical protein